MITDRLVCFKIILINKNPNSGSKNIYYSSELSINFEHPHSLYFFEYSCVGDRFLIIVCSRFSTVLFIFSAAIFSSYGCTSETINATLEKLRNPRPISTNEKDSREERVSQMRERVVLNK